MDNHISCQKVRRGVILVVVLIVIVLLTLSVLTFSKFMSAQRRGTRHALRQTQVRLLAESGAEYMRNLLAKDTYTLLELGGLYDNPAEFCGHIVTDGTIVMGGIAAGTAASESQIDSRDVGRFSVTAPALSENGILTGEQIRFGLEDESCKVNLRMILQIDTETPGAGRILLMRLPGVTIDIADAILDWLDEDNEPREYGAEDDYYASLDPPYYSRNKMPDSIDELLLVRGMTPKLLYGIDWNRNGIIDRGEPDEITLDESGVTDGSLNLGLAAYLTLDSRESMTTPDGLKKINVNMEDLDELRSLLEERFEEQTWVDYIISYRQGSTGTGTTDTTGAPADGSAPGTSGSTAGTSSTEAAGTETTIKTLFDLVGGNGSPFAEDADAMRDYMPLLYDNLTTSDTPVIGRININQAPRAVLNILIPGEAELEQESGVAAEFAAEVAATMSSVVENILAARVCDPALIEQTEMNYPFWIYTQGFADFDTMKSLAEVICTQGAVFKGAVTGRFDEQSPVSRHEVWLDASEGGKPAKIIRIRDISELGPGYTAELLNADAWAR
ncbi:MAG: general secretion pathway protein GspK [Planctomycetaceae bacterium]|jgi:hypothetical protein|nr:general secretion pathway protein GspK [Planctomycetaceae bacterium]